RETKENEAVWKSIFGLSESTNNVWEQLLQKNRELKADLAVMRDIGYDRWGNIVQQNKELEIQIARFERLAELSGLEQAFPQAFDSAPLREAAETLQSMAIPSSTNRQLQQTLSYLQQIGVIDPSVDIT